MRVVAETGRSFHWHRFALFATIAIAAAGCSAGSGRFDSNPYQADARPTAGRAAGSVAQRSPAVQAQPLPAPTGTAATRPAYVAPATASTAAPRPVASSGGQKPAEAGTGNNLVHVVARGETLMKLSRKYRKSLSEIAKANNIASNKMVKVGDRIVIPGQHGSHAVAAAAPSRSVVETAPKQAAKPVPEKKVAKAAPKDSKENKQKESSPSGAPMAAVVTPPAHDPKPEKAKRDMTAAAAGFRWPVRGRVISAFGPKPTGQQNDGINVAVPEGTPIKAAEDGVVAYAGNELKSYGNLVLIRHPSGYVTAYAHAGEILVKRDEPIKRGQVIARAGQTGNVTTSQLHFEIRKGSTPVDPLPLLDKGGNG